MSFSYGQKIITNGLVLYLDAANIRSYPRTGSTWYDLSINNYSCDLVNMGSTGFTPSNAGCILFDGADDYVRTPIINSNWATVPFTITTFIKWDNVNIDSGFCELRATSTSDWGLLFGLPRPGVFYYYWSRAGTTVGRTLLNNNIVNDRFIHFAITFNGVGGTDQSVLYNNTNLYINGVLQTVSPEGSAGIPVTPEGGRLLIGSPLRRFKGAVSNFLYYNRPLSQPEILQNYNSTKARFQL